MPKKVDVAAELSAKMTRALEEQRGRGEEYPTTLGRLHELADLEAPPELVLKAAGKPPLSQQAFVAKKKTLAAPVALREDLDRLAASPQLLEFALEALSVIGSPPWPLNKVTGQLDRALHQSFETAIGRQIAEATLPESVTAIEVRGKPHLYLKRQPPPKPPDVELAEKLLRTLREQRDRNVNYPLPLKQLIELADPGAAPDLVAKAIGNSTFTGATLPAAKKNLEAPVALKEDSDRLAASPVVLNFVLRATCTEAAPTAKLPKLKAKLDRGLRDPFERAVQEQIAENALPADVEWLPKAKALHPRWLPLPKAPEAALSERLVRVLEGQRRLGAESYPVRLLRLVELTGLSAPGKVLKMALAAEPFVSRAVLLVKKHTDSPVALADDTEQAVHHPALLQFLVDTGRTETAQALSVSELKAQLVKQAQEPFLEFLTAQMETGSLPDGIGWIDTRKERLFFRLADVRGSRGALVSPTSGSVAGSTPGPGPVEFEAVFDRAFDQLDRENGSYNFVSLVDLRRALPSDRATFDAQLRRLRETGRYTLRAAEGRHGITEEQRGAGIMEEGTLLLFVSRR